MSGHGGLLKQKIGFGAACLASASDAFWEHPRLAAMFPEFLIAIHGSVRATIPLMETAGAIAARAQPADAVCACLADYFSTHIAEERDHEDWLLSDLEAIGIARRDVLARIPPPAIAGMVGAQYYWIRHAHPVSLLGFFAVLEGHPPALDHLLRVEARTGLPPEAFRMLRHHATADQQHAADLFALLDRLPLSPFHVELLGTSALHTIAMLQLFFTGLTARHTPGVVPAPELLS
jgi:heme oxygenase-like protein